jgi:decaprenylphospho-beta-D-erythro-pentofuranosid-2-ulose 2-reductase
MTTGKKNISTASLSAVLVVGATSSLAQAICRALAKAGHSLILAARDEHELDLLARDLNTRFGTDCRQLTIDLMAADFSPAQLIEQAENFNQVVIAVGDMGGDNVTDLSNIAYTAHINYVLPAQIAASAAEYLSMRKAGTVVIISSVAGDRGRQSNYPYGSAKAALTAFVSGLRNRYYKHGVHVMTVKPGFIDTPMTWNMASPLIASREHVAECIVAAMRRKKDVVYVPAFWQLIMLIITHIPERIFKKLSL